MVLAGQFLERPSVLQSGGFFLEALAHRGERAPALLICPPHPLQGGSSMDSPVCAELAFAASQRGHPTLRFNYRGVGASQGPLSEPEACYEDARAALALLRENVPGRPVVVAGYDFGADVALELAGGDPSLRELILIAPSASALDEGRLGKTPVPARLIVGELDTAFDRVAVAEACQRRGDRFVCIAGADRAFHDGLALLGREVAGALSPD